MLAKINNQNSIDLLYKVMLWILMITVLSFVSFKSWIILNDNHIYQNLFFIFEIVGLLFCILLLARQYGWMKKITSSFCSNKINSNINCDSVLMSKSALILGDITWSDIGLVYFIGMLSISLFFDFNYNNLAYIISSFLATPYIFFSIYFQWRILHAWCLMCLVVQFILVCQTILSIYIIQTELISYFFVDIFSIILMLLFVISLFFTVNFLLKQSIKYQVVSYSYENLKYNNIECNLFTSAKLTSLTNGSIIFNQAGDNKITLVMRFGCTPCIQHIKDVLSLIKNDSNIAINFIFYSNQKNIQEELPIILYFTTLYFQNPSLFLSEMKSYAENFPISKKNYISKWNHEQEINPQIQILIRNQIAWCVKYGIINTPTLILNDRIVSRHYNFKDLIKVIESGSLNKINYSSYH